MFICFVAQLLARLVAISATACVKNVATSAAVVKSYVG
jgi:hypothetical protein